MNRLVKQFPAGAGTRRSRGGFLLALGLAALAGACGRDSSLRKHALRGGPTDATGLIASALGDAGASGKTLTFAGGDTLHVGGSAVTFYRGRGWKPAWTDGKGLTDVGRAVLAQLSRTGDDGLSPVRYHYATAQKLAAQVQSASDDNARASAAANLDLLVSEGFARYADDLAAGSLDPKQAGLEWHMAKERAPKVQALQLLAGGTRPDSIVTQLRPHSATYAGMMQALARYRQIAARGGWPQVSATGATGATPAAPSTSADTASGSAHPARQHARRGGASSAGLIAAVRTRLLASEDPTEATLAAAGRAAPATLDGSLKRAIAHYQKRMGLEPNGKPGAQTLEAMNMPVQERVQTLALNMDRFRWLPRDLGNFYVMVNLPAFKVDVMQDGKSVMEQRVVVGKPGWNTPVFADRMVQLIVNPYWNVPKSIVAEELGPEMAKDPNYLADHHFQQTSDGGYRQMPGPQNSLGLYKFQLTNDEDIYLHDTPAKDLFGKSDRDLSHGCIRLQDARAMALLIGQHGGVSADAIDRARASGQNHVFDLSSPVPTYIMYFTAMVEPDGTITFYPDVYGLDKRMAALLPKLEGKPVDHDTVARDSTATADSVKHVKATHSAGA